MPRRLSPLECAAIVGAVASSAGVVYLFAFRSGSIAITTGGPMVWDARWFSYPEVIRSSSATRHGIENTPNVTQAYWLLNTTKRVMDPLRGEFGAIDITSGFRTKGLNDKIGGAKTSQHMKGQAFDFLVRGRPSASIFGAMVAFISRHKLPVRQAILYHPSQGGHIHIGYGTGGTQVLYKSAAGSMENYPGGSYGMV